ncbi:MAG: 6-bladed beta-propeller [Planctomycetota bacterium]
MIALPLGWLLASAAGRQSPAGSNLHLGLRAARTLGFSALVAVLAVALGYVPGQLLGTARRGQGLLLGLLLLPLLLPQYLVCYCWAAVRSQTTALGAWLSAAPAGREWADAAAKATAVAAMVLWYWPLAALLIGQGWRNLDAETLGSARLDAGPWRRMTGVVWPLLGRTVLLALVVCFVWSLSESATFQVAIVETLGTDLAEEYAKTGSEAAVTRAAWPLMVAAAGAGVFLWRRTRDWSYRAPVRRPEPVGGAWRWGLFGLLILLSLAAPVALLVAYSPGLGAVWTTFAVIRGELGWSVLAAAVGAAGAILIATSALLVEGCGRAGRTVSRVMQPVIFLAMFLPGATVAAALVRAESALRAATGLSVGWTIVSAGLAARFAGLALVILRLARDSCGRHFAEMASVDGASWWQAWRWVHLRRVWLLPAAALALLVMMGITELPATALLTPPGVGSFSKWLIDQMHYLRDRDAMAASLVLVLAYVCVGAAAAALLWVFRKPRTAAGALACILAVGLAGCESTPAGCGRVEAVIGETGRGAGQFMYPRAIDLAADGTLFVVDKTGRIQRFSPTGRYLGQYQMPAIAAGKPTGLTVGPDGHLYVADTHYHRVVAFDGTGKIVRRLGRFGEDDGGFIFPTDVAFGPDGTIYVSEYGGNDRVSMYSRDGAFLRSFGRPGAGRGEFTRPSALAVDASRGRLYVADAANHRIAIYDLSGELVGYMGSAGREAGQLRYPYDLALCADGSLLVCEFGNNRIQRFDREGRSTGVWGSAGL